MSSAPLGRFRAHSTRDGEALARDGQPYYAINRLSDASKPDGERISLRSSSPMASGYLCVSTTWLRCPARQRVTLSTLTGALR